MTTVPEVDNNAKALAAQGFHVFPLRFRGKKPATEHGFLEASNDEAAVSRLFAGRRTWNVGIATAASGLIVVDIDVKDGKLGQESWDALIAEHGKVETRVVRTWSGGRHLWFWAPEGSPVRNSQGRLGPGLDIRAEGGYVVAPGSIVREGDAQGAYEVDDDSPIEDCPEWLHEMLVELGRKPEPQPMTGVLAASGDVLDRVRSLSQEIAAIPVGSPGEEAVNTKSFMVGQYVGAGQIDSTEAVSILLDGISGWTWDRPSDYDAFVAKIERGVADGSRSPRPWEERSAVSIADTAEVEPKSEAAPGIPGLSERAQALLGRMMSPADVLNMPVPDPLIYGLMDQGKTARLIGPSNVGKSFMSLDMAASVATGRDWQGRKVTQGRVVYLVAEGVDGMGKRIRAWEQHNGVEMTGVAFLPIPVQASDLEGWRALEEACAYLEPNFIILDTQARITVGLDENAAKDMGVFVNQVESLKRRTRACVMIVHHTGHEGSRARGSTAVTGAFDHEMVLTRNETTGVINLKQTKQRDSSKDEKLEFKLKVIRPEDVFSDRDESSCVLVPAEKREKDVEADVMRFTQAQGRLMESMEKIGQGTKSAIQALFRSKWHENDKAPSDSTFYDCWKVLEKRGYICEIEVRKGIKHFSLVSEQQRKALALSR